jgi:hypothetical protein
MVGQMADGEMEVREMPAAYVVVQVLERRPPSVMSFEEAANGLAAEIADRKALAKLREEHGVAVYEDKMPDPAGYGDQFKDSIIETDVPGR